MGYGFAKEIKTAYARNQQSKNSENTSVSSIRDARLKKLEFSFAECCAGCGHDESTSTFPSCLDVEYTFVPEMRGNLEEQKDDQKRDIMNGSGMSFERFSISIKLVWNSGT